MTSGSGSDTFAFIKGQAGGTDLVLDFTSADKIKLSGYGGKAIADALATQTVSHGSSPSRCPTTQKSPSAASPA
jgi:Ca2+-binding RTX toxin-like protein